MSQLCNCSFQATVNFFHCRYTCRKKKKENSGSEVRWARWDSSGMTCETVSSQVWTSISSAVLLISEAGERDVACRADVSASCCRCLTLAKQQRAECCIFAQACTSLPCKCAGDALKLAGEPLCNAAKNTECDCDCCAVMYSEVHAREGSAWLQCSDWARRNSTQHDLMYGLLTTFCLLVHILFFFWEKDQYSAVPRLTVWEVIWRKRKSYLIFFFCLLMPWKFLSERNRFKK